MKVTRRALAAAVTAVLAAVALAACSPESSDPAPAQTATTQPTTAAPTTEPTPAPETTEPTEGATEEAPAAETAEVPDVVGMNHAEAQSLLRSKGFMVNEEDASPEGRMILNNSNWKVCSQDPQPGATDALRVAIYSVKLNESC
ncbi:PASTA domain-containing protein [Streptomyces zaomyceticus]|uniref:PASTA domain-containing protein n=1 Tax=Streptomyces zaomyceticus TaxID=68286 RepID=UPI002E12C717|nr:PASTA domain-containing protein [Streptomyces zaomyceticus]